MDIRVQLEYRWTNEGEMILQREKPVRTEAWDIHLGFAYKSNFYPFSRFLGVLSV
jgi:hypothetical protein